MATERGRDTRLKFGDGAVPEEFDPLGGEMSFSVVQQSNDMDTTDKDGPSGQYVPGRINFSVSGNVKLPNDALERAYEASKSGEEITLQAAKGAIIRFQGAVTVGNFKADFSATGPVPYSFDMTNADAPTVNNLAATA